MCASRVPPISCIPCSLRVACVSTKGPAVVVRCELGGCVARVFLPRRLSQRFHCQGVVTMVALVPSMSCPSWCSPHPPIQTSLPFCCTFTSFLCATVILLIHPWLPWWRVSTPQHLCVSLVCLACMHVCMCVGVVLHPPPRAVHTVAPSFNPCSPAKSEYCT